MDDHFETNLKRWDEAVDVHVNSATEVYRLADFRAGADTLGPIESSEIGDVAGKSVLHLQCHFGLDTLNLARRGATVTGLDFSPKAVAAARALAAEAGLEAAFVEGNVYDAPDLIEGRFDIVYVTWGTIVWLPDIVRWADVVAHFLKPGGFLYFLDGHPTALMFEQEGDRLELRYPYFETGNPMTFDSAGTYTGDDYAFRNTRTFEWPHALSEIVNALLGAGLRLDMLNEHQRLAWKLFAMMETQDDGMEAMPAGALQLPLAFSLKASKPG